MDERRRVVGVRGAQTADLPVFGVQGCHRLPGGPVQLFGELLNPLNAHIVLGHAVKKVAYFVPETARS